MVLQSVRLGAKVNVSLLYLTEGKTKEKSNQCKKKKEKEKIGIDLEWLSFT